MEKRYKAYIDAIHFSIELEGSELCTFITHFGQFGNIEIYDQRTDELVLNTVGIFIDKFYPDIINREKANLKARSFHHLFVDYNYQRQRKYPKGGLRKQYILLKDVFNMD
ncbi:hypothetical protein [Anaerorhabdus sp.]|uniref:hypothetical protein n=1 Tax=Anaerorhabdus sp. TaxID=1872524 RepID=UPI002FCBD91D